jgi:hypothetical protein
MKLKHLQEAKYHRGVDKKQALFDEVVRIIIKGKPTDVWDHVSQKKWFFLNNRNQLQFKPPHGSYMIPMNVAHKMGMRDAPHIDMKKVLNDKRVKAHKNKLKGKMAGSGKMKRELQKNINTLQDEIDHLESRKQKLANQLKKLP